MAIHYSRIVFLFFIFATFNIFCFTATISEAKVKSSKLIVKLINRNSIQSPFYKPHPSIQDKAKFIFENSLLRFANDKHKSQVIRTKDGGFLFLIRFYIGNPSISQLAIMDTGSSLLWVQCSPTWYISPRSPIPLLDPLKSSTYASIPCESKLCQYFPHNSCIKEQCYYNITYLKAASSKGNAATEQFIFESLNEDIEQCYYNITYLKAASSKGNAATEEFIFESLNEDIVAVSQLIFGCSAVVDKYIEQGINGVFGLGPQKISMASQLGNKFSYCIGDFYDPNYNYIQLFLGDGASMDGYATPLEMSEAHYYLNLRGIDIGANELDIDEAVFWRNITDQSKLTGVIIDTGSPATWLIDQAYYRFRNEVRRILSQLAIVPISKCVYCLCFKGNMTQELEGFPDVIYHFSEGADLQVGFNGIFYYEKFRYITIIGMMAQQNYNVGYDLVAKKLYFQYIDCQLYAD
ncbi:hypothetical protein P3X46_004082 [Hevea brasiliensis]|uniref:Peptidase A1 domain-containing protein n=1 Tax=Hevea brasiliensis TaxID=3981 RepID=A0ABQ9MXJ7_HEVBR|nr:hypothetical protein P3X46_004082 [Hevea brasiliensis]